MIRRPPRSTQSRSSAASDVYKRQYEQRYGESIPVIAAGGIFTGADIYRSLQLGASGVQMATRFVGTYECDASMEFKEAYLKSKEEDVVIINSPVGMPGRAIRNEFLDDVNPVSYTHLTLPTIY